MCELAVGAAPLSLPYAVGPAAGAGTRSPRRDVAGVGEVGALRPRRGATEGRLGRASLAPRELPPSPSRRRCVTQRCGRPAPPQSLGLSPRELPPRPGTPVGCRGERRERCVEEEEESGVPPPRLMLGVAPQAAEGSLRAPGDPPAPGAKLSVRAALGPVAQPAWLPQERRGAGRQR